MMIKSLLGASSKIEARFAKARLLVLLVAFGPKVATFAFTHFATIRRTEKRVLWLQDRIAARYGRDAAIRMAQYYLPRCEPKHYRPLLCRAGDLQPTTEELRALLPAMLQSAIMRNDGVVHLVLLLLERGAVALAIDVVTEHSRSLARGGANAARWPTQIRALCLRSITAPQLPPDYQIRREDLVPGPAEHRLLLTDHEMQPGMIRHLAEGAKALTLVRFNELYGQLKLELLTEFLPGVAIHVEHARSRNGRFSARYYKLHQQTLRIAECLADSLLPKLAACTSVDEDTHLAFVLAVADRLFFKSLRMEGCLQALLDPKFDSIIISTEGNQDLLRLIVSSPAVTADERILIGSWSAVGRARTAFLSRLGTARARVASGAQVDLQTIADDTMDADQGKVGTEAEEIGDEAFETHLTVIGKFIAGSFQGDLVRAGTVQIGKPKVALVTSGNRAYLSSAVQAAHELQRDFNVDILWSHGRIETLLDALKRTGSQLRDAGSPTTGQPAIYAQNKDPSSRVAEAAFVHVFRRIAAEASDGIDAVVGDDVALRVAVAMEIASGLSIFMIRTLARLHRAEVHLSAQGYRAVVLCPVREPRNAIYVAAARHSNIPSLTVEPHCLNATYCRYSAVLTDFAALYSDYFVDEYAANFSISPDRCFVVGSPRITRPVSYDPNQSRLDVRKKLGLDPEIPIVAVPTQPMPASHTDTVFRFVVRAVVGLGRPVRLYVKPHPEENEADRMLYREIILSEGGEDLCCLVDFDIKELLIASDLVVSYYSVTALEAAVLERNIVIAGREGHDYPMPYHRILSVPLCHDAAEMRDAMIDTFDNRDTAATSVVAFKAANPVLFDNSTLQRISATVAEVATNGWSRLRTAAKLPLHPFVTAPFREYLE